MKPLPETAIKVLGFIKGYQKKNDSSPTFREIAAHFGVCIGTVQYHLRKLSGAGLISYKPRLARTIKVNG